MRNNAAYLPENPIVYIILLKSIRNRASLLIFVGLFETPNVTTGGSGGGSQSDLPWRDKDEDDLQWARRCARTAGRLLGKKPKSGLKR